MFKTESLASLRMVVTCAIAMIVFCGCGQTESSMEVIPIPATIDNGDSSTQESLSLAASDINGLEAGSTAEQPEPAEKQLNVGDLAPPLKIGQWVLGDAVDPLPSGRVRVVEFWATWCTPCLVTMPYLSQLQEEYGDTVEIVGITQEPVDNVQDYLDSYQAPGVTRRQMLKYRLAIDADNATNVAYMDAAGQSHIPTAFLVGKDGIIEWIGHASIVDDPLAKVVAGEWDREAAIADFKRDREFLDFRVGKREVPESDIERFARLNPASPNLLYLLGYELKQLGRYDEAAAAYEQATKLQPDNRNYMGRFESLREAGRLEEALKVSDEFVVIQPTYDRAQRFELLTRLRKWDLAAADVEYISATRAFLSSPWWLLGPEGARWDDEVTIRAKLANWIAGENPNSRWTLTSHSSESRVAVPFFGGSSSPTFAYAITRLFMRDPQAFLLQASGPIARIWNLDSHGDLVPLALSNTEVAKQESPFSAREGWNTLLLELDLARASETVEMQIVLGRDSSSGVQAAVSPGATWRYLHPVDGRDPAEDDFDFHQTFFLPDYDDSGWKFGVDQPGVLGGFGYGDPVGVNIGQPPKPQRFTAYFRHEFESAIEMQDLVLKLQRDDGVIVYLNGEEVARDNMDPEAVEAYRLLMGKGGLPPNGTAETELRIVKLLGKVVIGRNVLAVSVHNVSSTSSDLRFGEVTLEGSPR